MFGPIKTWPLAECVHFKIEIRKICRCRKTCKLVSSHRICRGRQSSVPRIIYVERAPPLFCSVNFLFGDVLVCRGRRVLRKVRKRLDRTVEIQVMKSFFWKKVLHGTSCLLLQDRSWSIAHSTLEISFCFCYVEHCYILFIWCMLFKSTLEMANHPIAFLWQWCSDIL